MCYIKKAYKKYVLENPEWHILLFKILLSYNYYIFRLNSRTHALV